MPGCIGFVEKKDQLYRSNETRFMIPYNVQGYDQYSFGIAIGRYISLTNKENALSVSVSANTVFYIGSFTDTAQPYFEWCKYYISPKDFNIAISKAPK